MKKKENLSLKRRNLVVVLLAFVLVISSMLTACGSSAAETTPTTKEEVVVDKVEEKTTEEVTQAETVVEEVVESTEEVVGPQSAKEWAQSVDTTEPKMTIWNDTLKEGIILEDGQKYVLRQDDMLLFCTKEKESGLSIDADLSLEDFKCSTSDNYVKIKFNKVFSEEILFEIRITVLGTEYPFSVKLISESATSSVVEVSETTQATEALGKDWVSSLQYEEPKLVVWNDKTGTKEVIELGGKYVMQEGDTFGMYCPEGYFLYNTFPIDVATGTIVVSNVVVIEFNLPSESQDINLEAEVMNPQQEFVTYNYVITTP